MSLPKIPELFRNPMTAPILAAVIYGLWLIRLLPPTTQITFIAPVVAAMVVMYGYFATKTRAAELHEQTRQREIEANERTKERELKARLFGEQKESFKKFIAYAVNVPITNATKTQKKIDSEIRRLWLDFAPAIVSWGSMSAIKNVTDFKNNLSPDGHPLSALVHVNDMLLGMRKELGHDDSTAEAMTIMKMIISAEDHDDLDEVYRVMKGGQDGENCTP